MLRHSFTTVLGFNKVFRLPGFSWPIFVRHRKNAPVSTAVVRCAQSAATERFEVPFADHKYYRYHDVQKDRDLVLKQLLEDPKRFQQIAEREDRSDTAADAFRASFDGKYFTFHRGVDVMKGCHDLVIYMQLFSHLKPATIIEIGAASGGTAIWMADMLKLMNIECNIYSMDIDLTLLHDRVKQYRPENVKFLQGDSYRIQETFTPGFLHPLPHPWIVIEDAHENFPDVLKHFHAHMQVGDYFVVDDTNPHTCLGMGKVYSESKQEWGPGKLNWLRKFLTEHNQYYAVDSFFTDFFGYNGTANWNGYIRRMN